MISYRDLLDVFWYAHSPTAVPWSIQYKSAIFYNNDEQERLAIETRDGLEEALGEKVYTEIVPATEFYPAEDYHQKYYLQQTPELLKELKAIYPDINDFTNSTAVARVNGYVGRFGTPEGLQAELNKLGLSDEGQDIIRGLAEYGLRPACAAPGITS